ncbi:MAG: hypothetical protein QM695_15790 [Micropruina sp.]
MAETDLTDLDLGEPDAPDPGDPPGVAEIDTDWTEDDDAEQ